MRLFDTDVQLLKYKVLNEVAKLAFKGDLKASYYNIPRKIAPGPDATMRCCIYRERAIVEERVKLALGGNKDNKNVVEVIEAACDECPVSRFSVTEACRGCIAHRCHSACPVGAISIEGPKAKIDVHKCIECGKCMKVCPYNAIMESVRPCVRGCKAGAIDMDENKKARINNEKCIHCGSCVYQCPFGAIVDKSYIVNAIDILKDSEEGNKYNVYAIIAPAIVSQFEYAKIGQVVAGLKLLGFHSVIEVALGADMVAYNEARELSEKGFLTSSCCPSFVDYIEKYFPEMKKHISGNVSPMTELSRFIKKTDPTSKVIFIGPCISKKMEFLKESIKGITDCVLTFEELQALFDAHDINIDDLEECILDNASYYGRIFARTGGLSEAVKHVIKDSNIEFQAEAEVCDGIEQCKIALLKASKGKLEKNFIEGMVCEGGCIGGAACLHHGPKNRSEVDKYGSQALEKSVADSIEVFKDINANL